MGENFDEHCIVYGCVSWDESVVVFQPIHPWAFLPSSVNKTCRRQEETDAQAFTLEFCIQNPSSKSCEVIIHVSVTCTLLQILGSLNRHGFTAQSR